MLKMQIIQKCGLTKSSRRALLATATHPRVSATAGGIFNGLGNFAGALSPAVMGALIAFTHSMDSGLIFLAVMAAVGCALLLPLLRRY